jgi:hypothetical protein
MAQIEDDVREGDLIAITGRFARLRTKPDVTPRVFDVTFLSPIDGKTSTLTVTEGENAEIACKVIQPRDWVRFGPNNDPENVGIVRTVEEGYAHIRCRRSLANGLDFTSRPVTSLTRIPCPGDLSDDEIAWLR